MCGGGERGFGDPLSRDRVGGSVWPVDPVAYYRAFWKSIVDIACICANGELIRGLEYESGSVRYC